jgi:hypothetical protein
MQGAGCFIGPLVKWRFLVIPILVERVSEKVGMSIAVLLEELLVTAEPMALPTNHLLRAICGYRTSVRAHGLVIARTV